MPDLTNDDFSYFELFIDRLDSENVEYYLLGDLNCDLGTSVLDHNSRSLTDIADLYLLFEKLNWKTLSFQRKVQNAVMVNKSLNGLASDYMHSGLKINLDVIPLIMTGGSLNLPVTAEFMPVIVTP